MGSEGSKGLSQDQIEELRKDTRFNRHEIREWHEKFLEDCPSGKLSKGDFQKMYEDLFPNGDSTNFSEYIFQAYDTDKNGHIDFNEFLTTVNVSMKGSMDDKLRWTFKLYDMDRNGYITTYEVKKIFKAIYKMRGQIQVDGDLTTIDDAVDQLFCALDKNKDGKLTEMEFVLGTKQSPAIQAILQPDDI